MLVAAAPIAQASVTLVWGGMGWSGGGSNDAQQASLSTGPVEASGKDRVRRGVGEVDRGRPSAAPGGDDWPPQPAPSAPARRAIPNPAALIYSPKTKAGGRRVSVVGSLK